MLPYLLLNIIVSAVTVIIIWTVFERRQPAVTVDDSALLVNSADFDDDSNAISSQPTQAVATAVPIDIAPTATPLPEGPLIHIVSAGETLGIIAEQYGVTVEEIVANNQLADANSIFQGQELTISDENQGSEAVAEEEAEVATATPLPTIAVQIGDTTFDISSISGVGDISAEQVLLVNIGANTVLLSGWTLSNDQGNTYTFEDVTLFGNGAGVTLHSGQGEKSPTDLYWGRESAAWSAGQILILRDDQGNLQTEKVVP